MQLRLHPCKIAKVSHLPSATTDLLAQTMVLSLSIGRGGRHGRGRGGRGRGRRAADGMFRTPFDSHGPPFYSFVFLKDLFLLFIPANVTAAGNAAAPASALMPSDSFHGYLNAGNASFPFFFFFCVLFSLVNASFLLVPSIFFSIPFSIVSFLAFSISVLAFSISFSASIHFFNFNLSMQAVDVSNWARNNQSAARYCSICTCCMFHEGMLWKKCVLKV